ncbi:hypothetical protein [Nonomuraea fuscirosea]|uniref:hypothetical protein n=1 Tax=Nonomuraea fuscirosea TaxID=1291556 RepID=UPI0034422C3C
MTGRPATRKPAEASYDGNSPLPRPAMPVRAGLAPVTLTTAIVLAPFIALGAGIWLAREAGSLSPTCCRPPSSTW